MFDSEFQLLCSAIVSKMDEDEIDYMIKQLVDPKFETKVRVVLCNTATVYNNVAVHIIIITSVPLQDPRFMDFLGNLCVCEGRAIPSTQS